MNKSTVSDEIFQMRGKLIFLILLFSFSGFNCNRDTREDGSANTKGDISINGGSINTEQILSEQEAKATVAEQAAEEAQRKVEAARETGDAAKTAEAEKQQKEAKAEAEKQRQIQTALQIIAREVLRANEAIKRMNAVKEQFKGTVLVMLSPLTDWEKTVNIEAAKAGKAFAEAAAIKKVSTVYDKGEETALAANRAEKQVQLAEEFASRFHSQYTFHSHEKALFPSSSDRTEDERFREECENFTKEFEQSVKEFEQSERLEIYISIHADPGCELSQVTRGGSKHYNCFCLYRHEYERSFYKR